MRYFILLSTLTALFLFGKEALANPYEIRNVAVDAKGESTIDAREKALNQARRNGFKILAKRLSSDESSVSTETIDDRAVASMVDSFEINREKTSNNRYMASVNIQFNQRAVQAYMGRTPTMSSMNQASFETRNTNRPSPFVQQGPSTSYKISMDLNGINQLIDIQKKLRSMQLMNNIILGPLNVQKVIMTLDYAGTTEQLQRDLNARGMQIYSNPQATPGDAPYVLMRRG